MFKKLVLIIAFTLSLSANLDLKIKNLLGEVSYETHKNLIAFIFQDEQAFYKDGFVNYPLVAQKLKENNLLKLEYPTTQYIDVHFKLIGEQKKSLFILKETLKSLGYYYYFTQNAQYVNNVLNWSIKLKTAVAINPLRLSETLALRNSKIMDIIREGDYKYTYEIDFSTSNLYKVEDLVINEQIKLRKPLKPYMIKVENANAIKINSNIGNKWHPNIVFYDNDLNILEIVKENSLQKSLKLDVPVDTRYIKIDDLYSLSNLIRGISITKE